MPSFVGKVYLLVRAWSRQAVRRLSDNDSSDRGCTGPSGVPTPSSHCGAAKRAAAGRNSGRGARSGTADTHKFVAHPARAVLLTSGEQKALTRAPKSGINVAADGSERVYREFRFSSVLRGGAAR